MPNFDKTVDNIKKIFDLTVRSVFFFFRRSKNSMIFSWSNFVFSPNQNPIMYGKIARKFSVRLLFLDVHRTQCTKRGKSVQYQKVVHDYLNGKNQQFLKIFFFPLWSCFVEKFLKNVDLSL